jgi:hypothetical protein
LSAKARIAQRRQLKGSQTDMGDRGWFRGSSRAALWVGRGVVSIVLACAAGACAHKAAPPVLSGQLSPKEKRGIYDRYRLTQGGNFFTGKTWVRKDGEYGFIGIEPLTAISPQTSELYSNSTTRGIVLGIPSGVGGGLIGAALVDEFVHRMSRGTRNGFYSVGGGLIVVTILIALAWRDPINDFASAYNRALLETLGLPEARSAPITLRDGALSLTF